MKSLETLFYMRSRLVFVTILLAVSGPMANAVGTIALSNVLVVDGTLLPMQWYPGTGDASTVPLPTSVQVVYGVFWGTNRNAMTLALPLGRSSRSIAGHIISTNPISSVYQIAGTEAGQKVYLQIKGWRADYGTSWMDGYYDSAYFSQTHITEVTLGPETGPGTAIWQSVLGTDPNKFHPLIFGVPLTPPLFVGFQPNPSVVVNEGSQGVVDATLTVNRFVNGPASRLNATTAVLLSTADMTAVAGQDYVPTNI